jgi:hypothetical protein
MRLHRWYGVLQPSFVYEFQLPPDDLNRTESNELPVLRS